VVAIAAGSYFENDENVQWEISGALIAEGASGNNITMTTSNEAGGIHWQGIFVRSSDSRNKLDYVTVSYAGNSAHNFTGSDFSTNVGVNDTAQMTITNSTISNSKAYGVYSIGTTNDIESAGANNTFASNPSGNTY